MKENKKSVFPGLFFIGIAVVIFYLLQAFSPKTEITPGVDSSPVVETLNIQRLSGPLNVVGEGFVRPRTQVSLSPQVSGQVVYKNPDLKPGGRFKEGDILLRIDPRNYEAEVLRIQGTIKATESQQAYAISQVKRLTDLEAKNAESQSRLEEQIAQRGNLEGQLIALGAQLESALLDLEHTEIKAPFNGAVFTEEIDVGNVISSGMVFARIYAEDIFEIIVALDDLEAGLIPDLWSLELSRRKIKAEVTTKYGNDLYTWDAHVDAVETGLDQSARTINIIVLVQDPGQRGRGYTDNNTVIAAPPLLPGMYASVSIEGLSPEFSALVPARAIHGENRIWILDLDNKLRIEPVRILQAYENTVVIQSELLALPRELITSDLPVAVNGMRLRKFQTDRETD